MSLFSSEEICIGCKLAVVPECCNKFCRCKKYHEEDCDYLKGKCPWRQDVV